MVESRRKTDIGLGEVALNVATAPPSLSHDPVEKQHLALVNRYLEKTKALEEARAQIEYLYNLAYTDDLTGLANKRLLKDAFEEAAARNEKIVLLFIDLNKFKNINDTYGHDVGDKTLKLVARTLASLTRPTDVIAHIDQNPGNNLPVRYAGDEFIMLFTGVTLEDLQRKITDLKTTFSSLSLTEEGQEIAVRASIGAYEYQKDDTLEHCQKQADIAMYADKERDKQKNTPVTSFSHPLSWHFNPPTSYVPTTTGYPTYAGSKPEPS